MSHLIANFLTTKMHRLEKSVRPQAVMLSILVLFCLISAAKADNLRLAVISNMNDRTLDAFYHRIASENPVVDPSARPDGIDDSDILVILLDTWADIGLLPQDVPISLLFKRMENNRSDTIRSYTVATKSGGTELHVIAYALKSTGYKSLSCYAKDIAAVLRNEFDVLNSEDCR